VYVEKRKETTQGNRRVIRLVKCGVVGKEFGGN
jgi:hypothetical protein